MSEARVKRHPQTDGSHCFVCGTSVPNKKSAKCGILGLVWADSGDPIVTCECHRGSLEEIVTSFEVHAAEESDAETRDTCSMLSGSRAGPK